MTRSSPTVAAPANTALRRGWGRCSAIGGLLLASCAIIPAFAQLRAQETTVPAPTPSPEEAAATIRSIRVTGIQRLEQDTIISYTQFRVGQTYTSVAADQAITDLAATGLFSQYSITFERGELTINLQENPLVNRILLEGNKRIKSDKILPEIKLGARQIFTRSKVRADVTRIVELYKRQGRFGASVEPRMVQLAQNRVDIVFEIEEGPKSKVRKINILGNEAFDDQTLLSEMLTRESRAKNFLSSGTTYDPDRLAFDQQKLRQFYLTNGYADFLVISAVAELTPDRRDFIVTYLVQEGERYKFGKIDAEVQLRDINEAALKERLPMRTGEWYDAKRVEDTVEQLTDLAGTLGYAFAKIEPRFSRNKDTRTMDVTFVLQEVPRVYVERVDVNGNTLTQDKVIRREFRVAEGDAFNSLSVKRSGNRIKSLGYFQQDFEIVQNEGSGPERIILEANVLEQATGELQLSGGYSSTEGVVGSASIRQRNFRGRGQTVGLSVNASGASQSVQASFTEPYLWDQNVSFGADIYRRNYDDQAYNNDNESSYQQATTGFSIRLGVPLSEYSALIGSYTLEQEDVTLDENTYFADLDGDGVDTCEPLLAGRYLCDAVGNRVKSIIGLTYNYSDLDSGFRPTRGRRFSVSGDFAGLGGNTSYARLRGQASQYWNVGSGFVASANLEGGYLYSLDGTQTRLTDRFFLGSPKMRGFDIRGVGPAIQRIELVDDGEGEEEDGDSTREGLGGNAYYLGRLELEIPLPGGARELGLRPSLFLDVGSVFGLSEPALSGAEFPEGEFIATRDDEGRALYSQTYDVNGDGTSETISTISRFAPNGSENQALGNSIGAFREVYVGDTWKPRLAIGFGVNWNSPLGPLRIDLAYPILSEASDETQIFSFNVGTQF